MSGSSDLISFESSCNQDTLSAVQFVINAVITEIT